MGRISLKAEIADALTRIVAEREAARGQSLRVQWPICDRPERRLLPLALPLCRRNIAV
jgi:hypothetical protein